MATTTTLARSPFAEAASLPAASAPATDVPLLGYAALVTAYAVGLGGFLAVASDRLPARLPWRDVALLAVATHKLSRTITLDWVTAPFRAPFTTLQESTGAGEVREKSRGRGLRRALGDLLTCPWCIGPWVATALGAAFVWKPRPTRFVTTIFAAVAASDFLHHAYTAAKRS